MAWLTTRLKAQKVVAAVSLMYLIIANWTALSSGQLQRQSNRNRSTGRAATLLRNSSIFKITNVSTNYRQIRLFCRVGRFLSMDKNGTISGVLRQNSKREIFELQSYGPSIVRIKHKATGRYIAMNSKGRLKGQKNPNLRDTYFFQNHEENTFVSFASHYHRKKNGFQMFLGVKRGGDVKYGRQTHAGQDSIQFLLLYVNNLSSRPKKTG